MSATLVPIHPISLWPVATVPSALVLPALLDPDRLRLSLRAALADDLFPVLTSRFIRLSGRPRGEGEYAYSVLPLDERPDVPLEVVTSTNASTPFASTSARVVQASLEPFVPALDASTFLLPDPEDHAPLLVVRLTLLPALGLSVLGVQWAHILGDGNALLRFLEILSALYVHPTAAIDPKPTFGPHIPVSLPLVPNKELENSNFTPSFPLAAAWERYGGSVAASEEVHLTLSADELATLKGLVAPGEGWVSTQDALTSYVLNVGELVGEGGDGVINSVNYRSFPNFSPNLPTLVANVAQLLQTHLAAGGSIARTLRKHLLETRDAPLAWLETAAYHLHGALERGETCVMVPNEREWIVNSNFRYDWTAPSFGTPAAAYHTTFTGLRLVRIFQSNDRSGAAECCFRLGTPGGAAAFRAEVERDRTEGFERWRGVL